MCEWGFTSTRSSQSDPDLMDFSLLEMIGRLEPSIFWCIGCGTCSATCTSAQFNGFNPRKTFLAVRSGRIENLGKEISKCVLCGKCQLECPRNVNTRYILSNLKHLTGKYAV
jgi:heterodisulfide reductase subunit C